MLCVCATSIFDGAPPNGEKVETLALIGGLWLLYLRRAWDEVGLRFRFARRSGLFRPRQLAGLLALFLVRVMPGPVKRLAYRHLR